MQKKYEIIYLISPELEEKKIESLKAEIKSLIEKNKGKISEEKELGKRKLAYKIGPHYYALYSLLVFDIDPSLVQAINKDLRLISDILRFLVVEYEEFKEIEPRQEEEKEETKPQKEEKIAKKEEKVTNKAREKKKDDKEELKTEKKEEKVADKEEKPEKSPDKDKSIKAKPKTEKADLSQLDQKIEKILEEEIF